MAHKFAKCSRLADFQKVRAFGPLLGDIKLGRKDRILALLGQVVVSMGGMIVTAPGVSLLTLEFCLKMGSSFP